MDRDATDGLEAIDEAGHECPFVVGDGDHRGDQFASTFAAIRCPRRARHVAVVAPDIAQVIGRRERARDRLVRRRPGLESVMCGEDLECGEALEDVGLAVQGTQMRPEPLVGRADQKVRVKIAYVDRAMRGIRHGIHVGQGADFMRPGDDLTDRVDRADRVAGIAHGDELRPRTKLGFEVLQVEGHVRQIDVGGLDGHAPVGGHRPPGGNVGLVVQGGDDDLVTGLQRRADGPTDVQGQGRHVVAELDLVGRCRAQEVGDGRMGLIGHRVTELARRERTA